MFRFLKKLVTGLLNFNCLLASIDNLSSFTKYVSLNN